MEDYKWTQVKTYGGGLLSLPGAYPQTELSFQVITIPPLKAIGLFFIWFFPIMETHSFSLPSPAPTPSSELIP